jgi:hypothetical protein
MLLSSKDLFQAVSYHIASVNLLDVQAASLDLLSYPGLMDIDPSTMEQPPKVDDEPSDDNSDSKWRMWEIKTNSQKVTLKAISVAVYAVNSKIMYSVIVFCSVCCPLNEAAGSTFMTYL